MSVAEEVQARESERSALVERAAGLAGNDPRIVAAWLGGSLGRGSQDAWSDIDLWLVVADQALAGVHARRLDFASRLGELLFTIEAPQNAPTGGSYLLMMYSGLSGPHTVDCYWQPRSTARRPKDTLLLFDNANISVDVMPQYGLPEARWERAMAQTRFFWMMTTLAAKYMARHDVWLGLTLLTSVCSTLNEVEWLVGRRSLPPGYRDHPDFAPPVTPTSQVAALRETMARMADFMAEVPALRTALSQQALEQVEHYCSLAERAARQEPDK